MEKAEIIMRLTELHRILDMSASEYVDEWNREHPDESSQISTKEVWAFRTGIVQGEIRYILKH